MRRNRTLQVMFLLLFLVPSSVAAQKGGGQSSGAASAPASPSLQGLSLEQRSWRDRLKLPPLSQNKRAVLCYRLSYGDTTAQPFLLAPVFPDPNLKTSPDQQPEDWQDFYQTKPPGDVKDIPDPEERKWFSDAKHTETPWTPCMNIGAKRPLKMNQTLVVAIDAKGIDLTRVRILNINITNQQGLPINATPVRPSFNNSGTGATQGSGGVSADRNPDAVRPYFLTWPNLLPGDVLPTVSVTAVYTPPVPGEAWVKRTFYPVGSVVQPTNRNGHYYVALRGGISWETEPPFPVSTVPAIQDGQILWVDSGPAVASSGANSKAPGIWMPRHAYSQGDAIVDPYNGHTYVALTATIQGGGTPAATTAALPFDPLSLPLPAPPVQISESANLVWRWDGLSTGTACGTLWSSNHPYKTGDAVGPYAGRCYLAIATNPTVNSSTGPDPIAQATPVQTAQPPDQVHEGTITWDWDRATTASACSGTGHVWAAGQFYPVGTMVGPYNGRCYVAASGVSGPVPVQPYFPSGETLTVMDTSPQAPNEPNPMKLEWQDAGTIPAATVTGAPASDQTINLMSLQLPQVHSLSYFNLAAGVVYSTVHSRGYGVPPGQTGQISTNLETVTSNTATVDPLLLLTVYPWPIDAETNCGFKCLKTKPGLSLGLSLASPSTSFYTGLSFELFRNVQLVLAANWAKESHLPIPPVQIPASTTTAVTSQRFSTGAAFGLTFNVSGFIQGLFGGGSSKGSSASSQ